MVSDAQKTKIPTKLYFQFNYCISKLRNCVKKGKQNILQLTKNEGEKKFTLIGFYLK